MVTLHTTNPYIYKQTNPPLQQALVVGTSKAKLWLLVKIVKQLAGTIKALWHKSPELWSMGFVPSGRHTAALGYKSHTTRNPWYNYNFTLYSLQCTPQPTIPTNQSYYSQQQVHTTIPKQRIGNYGVCGWKDRCRDGNLRTYCHVSSILFGWFLWKPALHVFAFL